MKTMPACNVLRKKAVGTAVFLLIILIMPVGAAAHYDLQASKQNDAATLSESHSLFEDCLSGHPNYHYGAWIDINSDGIDELLLTDSPNGFSWTFAALCAISEDGERVISWSLFSHLLGYRYDPDMRLLVAQSSGTGVNEFCAMELAGDSLTVRHIGRNGSPPDAEQVYYYDFTEETAGGEDIPVYYNFGEKPSSTRGVFLHDPSILQDHAITREEYCGWYDYLWNLEEIELTPSDELLSCEPSQR